PRVLARSVRDRKSVSWQQHNKRRRASPASFTMAAWQGSAGQLLFLDLRQLLAVDAQLGGGAGFQATNADLDAARFAEAVLVLVDHVDCFLDLLEQLALAITGAQFQCELFFLGGAVVRVRQVGGLVLQMVDGAIRLLHQLLAPGQQDLAEVLALRFVHVLFALGGHVRCEAMHGGARLRCRNVVELSFHFRWYLYRGFDCFPRTGRRRLHRRCRALRRQCLGHFLLAGAVLFRLFGRRLGGSFLYCRLSGGRRFLC